MTRIRTLIIALFAVFAVSAVASASASAATCHKVAPGETGHWLTNACSTTGTTKEYVLVEKMETDLGSGVWCAKVSAGEPSAYSNNTCTTAKVGTGEYAKVLENENEQQYFENAAGKEPEKKGFTSKEGVSTLAVSTATVTCEKDTNAGKLVGKESVEKVVITFTGCKGKKGTEECPVKSKGATGAEEIVTNSLKGELGEVAASEAASEVGLLLEGESSNVFVTLIGKCLPVEESAIEGSVVGEVTPLTLGLTDKTEFLVSAGAQKIKTFERSLALHCSNALATRKCEADFSFKTGLKAFGLVATFASKDENKFEEELKVHKGV
jgi:hypothetical protein